MLLQKAAEKNILIDVVPFIETEPVINEELKRSITSLTNQDLTVVFTSMNAVDAVGKYLNGIKPNWRIFCIGSATKKFVTSFFDEKNISGIADAASTLADLIIDQKNISFVVFFCGDKRRDELPGKLRQHNIEVKEIEVYKTFETAHQIKRSYDAILFYSPSAVNSFFSVNKTDNKTILFAIGKTTASEIKRFGNNKIIIADEPSKELLAEQAINYFQTYLTHH
ncbi:MAG: uroporphyrinogen-III synthase [Bacteroidetes bacterium]|nr:uroporphyrinogen-III synthase [Bacteroidota bacterium]